MKLLRLAPAKFIHFGTTREILELMNGGVDEYYYLGWSRKVGSSIRSDVSGYNSVLSSRHLLGRNVIWRFLMCMEIPGLAVTVCSLT